MRYLIISQVFFPDTVSVSQHISDLAFKLVEKGNSVTIFTSCRSYEDKKIEYLKKEIVNGVIVYRLPQTSFGKSNILYRIIDFFTFYCSITFKLLFVDRRNFDIIIGTTVPPLLSFIGVLVSKWKRLKFVYWIMDLQPELSIISGLIKNESLSAKIFTQLGNYIFKSSDRIISLDRFMTKYILTRGAQINTISTIPVWPVVENKFNGNRFENPFRIENNFGEKIVVMYSGNHAFVHPLDTLLSTALRMKDNPNFLFVFVGGGVRKKDVTTFKNNYRLQNIVQLPFQPRENIHFSLGASDIQVVILGEGQVGYTHPNKIYGALYIGKPILYIGPQESHIGDILSNLPGNISVGHGEIEQLTEKLDSFAKKQIKEIDQIGANNQIYAENNFHPEVLKLKMIEEIEKK